MAGIDKHPNRHRHFAAIDEIVKHILNPVIPVRADKGLPVLKDHQGRRFLGIVLRRDKDPIMAGGVGEHLARQRQWPDGFALWHPFMRQRIGAEAVNVIRRSGRRAWDSQQRCNKQTGPRSQSVGQPVRHHMFTLVLHTG